MVPHARSPRGPSGERGRDDQHHGGHRSHTQFHSRRLRPTSPELLAGTRFRAPGPHPVPNPSRGRNRARDHRGNGAIDVFCAVGYRAGKPCLLAHRGLLNCPTLSFTSASGIYSSRCDGCLERRSGAPRAPSSRSSMSAPRELSPGPNFGSPSLRRPERPATRAMIAGSRSRANDRGAVRSPTAAIALTCVHSNALRTSSLFRHLPLAVIASGDGSSRSGLAGERTGGRLWCVSRLGRCDGEGPASRCSRCSSRLACQAESKPRT